CRDTIYGRFTRFVLKKQKLQFGKLLYEKGRKRTCYLSFYYKQFYRTKILVLGIISVRLQTCKCIWCYVNNRRARTLCSIHYAITIVINGRLHIVVQVSEFRYLICAEHTRL